MGKFKFYAIKLSLIIIAVFFLQLLINNFTGVFILTREAYFEPWRFVTSIFLHGGLAHLIFNLFALIFFGSVLERLVGGKRFLFVFFTSGIAANLISVYFYPASLGASGAIFGVIGALVIVRPMLPIFAFGLPMPMFVAGLLWAIGDILGTYGFFTGNPLDNTGNIAHLSGMFFGLFFGLFFRSWKGVRKKRNGASIDEKLIRQWEDYFMRDV